MEDNIFEYNGNFLVRCIDKTATKVIIPNSVTNIGNYVFCRCPKMKSIIIKDSSFFVSVDNVYIQKI